MTERRRKAWRAGQRGERLAVWRLRLAGWRILARDWRCPAGEIDIVAQRGRLVLFVEVKARSDAGLAGEAIGRRQQGRIAGAAALFLARHPHLAGHDARFDAMLVAPWRWPVHLRDAWRQD
ncbi:MAG TPA: YraN family protein [Alphaproteobacteria bacterium]|jgi:putative endonuclease